MKPKFDINTIVCMEKDPIYVRLITEISEKFYIYSFYDFETLRFIADKQRMSIKEADAMQIINIELTAKHQFNLELKELLK